ncbi:hypothetical protein NP493_172g03008 [Ridgeia piscesae]|uniref:Uncharacterized protein n=1 Tax=Ridgeia piscesae TaxID=27915 RepID=A0AAD9P323_RIDPI|nr:hypothetical protein NP493_172g03008 [Ridgeia piscesae]
MYYIYTSFCSRLSSSRRDPPRAGLQRNLTRVEVQVARPKRRERYVTS